MTVDRTEGVEPATAIAADEADATPAAPGTETSNLANGEARGAVPIGLEIDRSAAEIDASANGAAARDSDEGSVPDGHSATAEAGGSDGAASATHGAGAERALEAVATAPGDAPPDDSEGGSGSTEEAADRAAAESGEAHTPVREPVPAAVADTNASADETAEAPPAVEDEDEPAAAPAPTAVAVDTRPEPTTMEELLAEQSTEIRSLKHGDVVEGNVVRIDKDEILVDIGAKSEGVVSNRELYGRNAESQPQLNIGDTVLVYVLQPESNEGHAVLSLRRAGLERKWRSMQEQLDAGVIIEAPVIDHNKGGLIVDCGIRGFVPISQIVDFPRRPQNEQPRDAAQEIAEKLQPYVGRKLRLKILEVNRKANRLILSEKVALYEERREKRDELFSSLKVGQQVKGTVRSIAPFGVFVDLGGIDGLVHKSELSWNKVNNPEAGYRVGEEVEAEVIDINHERGRISLSIRRLQPDPWHSTVADLKVNDVIEGTVTKIVNFGAFVRVREGLEGLIHISELSQQRVAHPGDVVHEGQKLNLKVISLDSERHRLGLSLKQAEETAAPARPATEGAPAPAPRERTERRGRSERSGYDASQAVQEPEGGIDNTLAAAFAQVRQQMAEQEESAASADDTAGLADAGEAATVHAATAETSSEVPTSAEGRGAHAFTAEESGEASAEEAEPPAATADQAAAAAHQPSPTEGFAAVDTELEATAEAADAVAEAAVTAPEKLEEAHPSVQAAPGEASPGPSEGAEASSGQDSTRASTAEDEPTH